MKSLGIKSQILLITLIPVFLIDLFFTYKHINTSIEQANELLQSKGQIIARQIADASEFNLFTGNDNQIQYLLGQAVGSNNIVLASVYDRQGKLIAKSLSPEFEQTDASNYYYYRQPVTSQSIEHSDVFMPEIVEHNQYSALGWVHLYISRQQLEHTINRIVVESIAFFISILIIAVILTVIISQKITRPIFRLMEHLKYVETGQLGKSIAPTESNEIGAVQQGFNQMTHALLANRRHLNRRIEQATHQLNEAITDLETKNRELGIARDQAQSANQTKSKFLANMSHEIRTPINGIKGFISLLSQSKLDSSQQRYVDIVLKSIGDLTSIVNEILDFSKMESGKLHIVDEEFDLYEVVEQTRDILFINVLTKNIDLNLIIYSDTPRYVIGDKLRLKQILLNLIGNAIKFTDQGQVVVRVSPEDYHQDEVEIKIEVEDSGIGISEQDQQSLFKAFSQVESSDTRRFAGTGLGLVISKNLATLMHGDISMQSRPGEGSKFTLLLPFKPGSNDASETTNEAEVPKALIFAASNNCLMEIRTLFDRAGLSTECSLVDNALGTDPVLQSIQRNLSFIDFLVFDLRHLHIDLARLLSQEVTQATRVIVMHYDQVVAVPNMPAVEFVSVINTSTTIARLLGKAGQSAGAAETVADRTQVLAKQVLLVDDNQVNLTLAGELIRLWGHQVTEAEHGSNALQLYRQHSYDLIILDIQMPDIDGVSLLHMMRTEKPDDQTPIVALTANVLNDEAGRLIDLGFDYFLGKPIDETSFRALLDGSLQRQPAGSGTVYDSEADLDCSLDYGKSLTLSADNESLLKQIFEILQRDIPEQQLQLANALTQQDQDRLGAIAHKLHGVTCYASLPRLRRKVLGFQQRLTRDNAEALDKSVQQLNDELGAVKLEVDHYLEEMNARGISS
jgi:two-component system sensor histidine kinase BarA